MIGYDEYLGRIRDGKGTADFAALRRSIGGKIIARQKARARRAAAGVLALFLISAAAYFACPAVMTEGGQLYAYVFEPDISDGPVLDYVFSD
ncbi:MAG: hypothetical protein JW873_06000 [Candidatus Saganbacteria bacterium]|nr:hypothetical protein [Candidatus Saganbacteria bacterium]